MAFLEIPALKLTQPLGEFFLAKFKIRDLLKVSFVEELQYIDSEGKLKGTQRKKNETRLSEIGKYIDSEEMAFPNSIILAANYTKMGQNIDGLDDSKDSDNDTDEAVDEVAEKEGSISPIAWSVRQVSDDLYMITIPTDAPLAAIIDGQHRINAFDPKYTKKQERFDLEIPCAIYFGLSNPYQAFLFATVNGNQKKVDRSLALEQFGFNVEEEAKKSWTPEKLSVYFTRRLNIETHSPLHKHIKVAPGNEQILFSSPRSGEWTVSTATVVDGILSLIASKPKRDRVEMAQSRLLGRSRDMIKGFSDSSPLRAKFIENNDDSIYEIINKYFNQVNVSLWANAKSNSYIIKTVGVLALFDFLKRILQELGETADFNKYLTQASDADFTDTFFQASGVGRSRIRMVLYVASGLKRPSEHLTAENEAHILRIIKRKPLDSQLLSK